MLVIYSQCCLYIECHPLNHTWPFNSAYVLTSQYLTLYIVFWYWRNVPSYFQGLRVVCRVPDCLAVIFEPNVLRLLEAGICPEYDCSGVMPIAVWDVRLYSHVVCVNASAQKSVPNWAEYNMHFTLSFNILLGRLMILFDNDESAVVALILYPGPLALRLKSNNLDSSPPLSVVMVRLTWSCSNLLKKSESYVVFWIEYFSLFTVALNSFDLAR